MHNLSTARRVHCTGLLVLFFLLCGQGSALAGPWVGGPCRYVDYPGRATIVTVTPLADANASYPYVPLEVRFTFTPNRPMTNDPLFRPGRLEHLTLTGGRAPGARFVEHYGIRPGVTLPCLLHTIRQGTCTPVLYSFPGIDLTSDIDWRPAVQ